MRHGLLTIAAIPLFSCLVFAQGGKVTRDGFDVHWQSEGTGQPLILLSGGPGFEVDSMKSVAEAFPQGYRRIYLEQRGTGRSRPLKVTPENMTVDLMVEDIEALRRELKLDRLFIVGESWGTQLAMAYAVAHSENIDRMILIAPPGATMEYKQWWTDNIESRLHSEDMEMIAYWKEAGKRGVDRGKVIFELFRAAAPGMFFNRAKGLAFAAQVPEAWMHVDATLLVLADAAEYDVREGLAKVTRPVLIVQGYQDPIGQKPVEEIHRLLSSSTVRYIPQCGHLPMVEQPGKFRAIINEFLNN